MRVTDIYIDRDYLYRPGWVGDLEGEWTGVRTVEMEATK